GGRERHRGRGARGRVGAAHGARLSAPARGDRRSRAENVDGVRVVRVGEWGRALSSPICPGFPAAIAATRADLWHLHSPNPLGEASFQLARPAGAMLFTYYCDLSRQRALLPLYGPLVHALLRRADVLRAISPQATERADSLVAPFRERFRVVPLGIDAAPILALDRDRPAARALRDRHGDPFLLFVGRLRHYK